MISGVAACHLLDKAIREAYGTTFATKIKSNPGAFPWPDKMLSDHAFLSETIAIGTTKLRIGTYNCLNKAYLHHMTADVPDNQLLQTHPMVTMNQHAREVATCHMLVGKLADTVDIVCLQEVSPDLARMLVEHMPPDVKFWVDRVRLHKGRDVGSGDVLEIGSLLDRGDYVNCNIIVYNGLTIEIIGSEELWAPENDANGNVKRSACDGVIVSTSHDDVFFLVNMHRDYGNNISDVLLTCKPGLKMPTIIAGDMNCGVRIPVTDASNHILTVFESTRFTFANPDNNPANPPWSHVTHLSNAKGDMSVMLDRFDHIVVMNKPPVNDTETSALNHTQ